MSDEIDRNDVGYGKPPKNTQFVKGQSGNPKGRPKGSLNLATILDKIGRQRVKVVEGGNTRYITKLEASILQTYNKAVHGDLKAFHQLSTLIQSLANTFQTAVPSPVFVEGDHMVMASIVERIRQAESTSQTEMTDLEQTNPSQENGKRQSQTVLTTWLACGDAS